VQWRRPAMLNPHNVVFVVCSPSVPACPCTLQKITQAKKLCRFARLRILGPVPQAAQRLRRTCPKP
jgi:hypothetical protein